jgi:conjugal transfer pilus assembly protein TraF
MRTTTMIDRANWAARVRRALTSLVVFLTIGAAVSPAFAGEGAQIEEPAGGSMFYCQQRKLGTWFYCSKPKPKVADPTVAAAPPAAVETATQQLEHVTAELRELKAKAILDPSTANITAYVQYQRQQLDRASMFSDVWQRAVWQNPDLDYTLQRPVGTVAKAQWLSTRKADEDRSLNRLGERYGIFYFFAQSCGACTVFSPILKSVADSHGLHVMAISTDGGPSDVFTRYSVDSGQRERMGLTSKATPAVVLYDTVTKHAVPIGYGVIAADELMDRIYTLTQTKPGSDY